MFVLTSLSGETKGWAVAISRAGSEGRGQAQRDRRLAIDHCTFVGKGVLALDSFTAEAPLQADLKQCLARVDALLMWKSPEKEPAKGVKWSGQSNRYEVTSAGWIVQPPAGPGSLSDAFPGSPTDLESWTKLMPDDVLAVSKDITFAPGASAPRLHQPSDFALPDGGASAVGADPAKVGPGKSAR